MVINVLSLQVAGRSPPVRPYAEGKTWGSLCLPINSPELTLSGDVKSGLRVVKALVEVTQWSQADVHYPEEKEGSKAHHHPRNFTLASIQKRFLSTYCIQALCLFQHRVAFLWPHHLTPGHAYLR